MNVVKGIALVFGLGIAGVLALGALSGPVKQATGSVATTTAKPSPTPVVLPGVGGQASTDRWAISLDHATVTPRVDGKYWYAEAKSGVFVILDMHARNLGKNPASLSLSDFRLTSADGAHFSPTMGGLSTSDRTPKVMSLSEVVQPGLTDEFGVLFEVDPNIRTYKFTAAGTEFEVNLDVA